MPIEIKELVIRAFVSDAPANSSTAVSEREAKADDSQDTLAMVANMIKQEKER